MATLKDFAVALLNTLGLEPTKNRLISLVAFGAIEGGHWNNTATYNPFNTTLNAPGAVSVNSVGVKAYPNWATGIKATAATIAQTNMRPIAVALKNNVDPKAFLTAVTQTPWCPRTDAYGNPTGCQAYDTYDPIKLYFAHANIDDGGGMTIPTTVAGDWLTQWGPWLLVGLATLTGAGLWYLSKKPGGIRGFLGVDRARRRGRRAARNRAKRALAAAEVDA